MRIESKTYGTNGRLYERDAILRFYEKVVKGRFIRRDQLIFVYHIWIRFSLIGFRVAVIIESQV